MTRPLLTATLIARNEKRNVWTCLESIWPHVDEVVVVDTGSEDGTLGEVLRYAKKHGGADKLKTATVKWTDDFSAARQAADDRATGEWVVWADFDDVVHGLGFLRQQAAAASEEIVGFFCRYDYARDRDGNCLSELWRERVVRNDGTKWSGRLHEHKLFTHGAIVKVAPEQAQWIHQRDHEQRTGERNLRILEKWDADQPDDERIISSIAMEYMGLERHKEASDTFARFLSLPAIPPDRRAQAARHMCVMLMMQGRVEEARAAAFAALAEHYGWADTHLTLAEVEQTVGRPDLGLQHAQTALQLGKPDTLLIVNPLQYTAHPRALMAVCLAQMGRFSEAVQVAEDCLKIAPSYALVTEHVGLWRGQLKKQHTVETWLASADVLAETGELLKARAMLDAAPFFVDRDPRLIGKRAEIVRLIRQRSERPEVAVDDDAADAFVARHQEALAA